VTSPAIEEMSNASLDKPLFATFVGVDVADAGAAAVGGATRVGAGTRVGVGGDPQAEATSNNINVVTRIFFIVISFSGRIGKQNAPNLSAEDVNY